MPKFDMKEYEREIREMLNPPSPAGVTAGPTIERLKEIAKRRRGVSPRLPGKRM